MNESAYASAAELLDYDPCTGVFRWRVARYRKVRAGDVAGYTDTRGYHHIRVDGRLMYAHRLAFFISHGRMPMHIDHINGVTSDNRIINLRECTQSENNRNKKKSPANTSGIRGVSRCSGSQKWRATIKVNYKTIHLGHYVSLDEAKEARLAAEPKHHGQFSAYYSRGEA